MLDQRLKQEPMYNSQTTTIKSDPVFPEGGSFASCDQQHSSRDMTSESTAFKSFDSNPMITIGIYHSTAYILIIIIAEIKTTIIII